MDRQNKKENKQIKIHKRKQLSKAEREKIFERDNYECQLCRPKKNLLNLPLKRRIDHKIPLSKGGSNDYDNLWLVCEDCDKAKKNKLFKRFKKKEIKVKLKQITHGSLVKIKVDGNGNNRDKNV